MEEGEPTGPLEGLAAQRNVSISLHNLMIIYGVGWIYTGSIMVTAAVNIISKKNIFSHFPNR